MMATEKMSAEIGPDFRSSAATLGKGKLALPQRGSVWIHCEPTACNAPGLRVMGAMDSGTK
jgi:hypothetical protein